MKNIVLSSAFIVASLSYGGVAYACDAHGTGYASYGLRNALWQSYNPKLTVTDPAFDENGFMTPLPANLVPAAKAKPTFSNAANNASMKAKTRVLKKAEGEKTEKKATVKKAALNTNR